MPQGYKQIIDPDASSDSVAVANEARLTLHSHPQDLKAGLAKNVASLVRESAAVCSSMTSTHSITEPSLDHCLHTERAFVVNIYALGCQIGPSLLFRIFNTMIGSLSGNASSIVVLTRRCETC